MNTRKISLALLALGVSWFVYYLLFSTSYFPTWTITAMGTPYSGWVVALGVVEMGSGTVAVFRSGVLGDKGNEKGVSERLLMSLVIGGLLGAFGFGVSLLVLSWPVGSPTLPTVRLDAQSQSDIEGIIGEDPVGQETAPRDDSGEDDDTPTDQQGVHDPEKKHDDLPYQ